MWQRRPSGPARPVWARTAAPGPFSQVPVCPEGVRCRRSFGTVWSCSRSSDCTPDLWENRWNIAHVSEKTPTRSTHYLIFPLTSLPPVFHFPVWMLLFSSQLSFTSKQRGFLSRIVVLNDFIFTKSFQKQEQKPDICADRFCVFQIYAGISKNIHIRWHDFS